MQEDFSDYFLGKKLFDVCMLYKDPSKDSSIKNVKLQLTRRRLDRSRPLTAKELHEMHSIKVVWKTLFGARTSLLCEVDLKHSSDIRLTLEKTTSDFDLKLAAAFNARTAAKNFYVLKLRHQLAPSCHLVFWFKKMATSSNDSLRVLLKNRARLEPYFERVLLDLAFVNRADKPDLDFRAKFYTLTSLGRHLRYAFQCEFSSLAPTRPDLRAECKLGDWNGLWLQVLWNLDLAQRRNTLSLICKSNVSDELAAYVKVSSKRETHLSLSYRPAEGVDLVQSVRFNWADYLLRKDCLNFGIGIKLWA